MSVSPLSKRILRRLRNWQRPKKRNWPPKPLQKLLPPLRRKKPNQRKKWLIKKARKRRRKGMRPKSPRKRKKKPLRNKPELKRGAPRSLTRPRAGGPPTRRRSRRG